METSVSFNSGMAMLCYTVTKGLADRTLKCNTLLSSPVASLYSASLGPNSISAKNDLDFTVHRFICVYLCVFCVFCFNMHMCCIIVSTGTWTWWD